MKGKDDAVAIDPARDVKCAPSIGPNSPTHIYIYMSIYKVRPWSWCILFVGVEFLWMSQVA